MDEHTSLPRILIAEDNPADVLMVREAFRQAALACSIVLVKDGEQAIEFIEALDQAGTSARLDIALLDMHLPKRDGVAILRRLRSTEFHAQTPVVAMTSSDAARDHQNAEKHAALHYFRKPMNLSEYMELGAIVSDILAGRAASPISSGNHAKEDGSPA